jgi:hypothetical protein
VRFAGAAPIIRQDRDIETLWCSDFDKLQKFLEVEGTAVAIEKATPLGAVPVKVVADTQRYDATRTTAPANLKSRSI